MIKTRNHRKPDTSNMCMNATKQLKFKVSSTKPGQHQHLSLSDPSVVARGHCTMVNDSFCTIGLATV